MSLKTKLTALYNLNNYVIWYDIYCELAVFKIYNYNVYLNHEFVKAVLFYQTFQ